MVCEYDTRQLREFMILLQDAESYLRNGRISEAINKYLEVKEKCFSNNKDLINAIYFNQKCITLAKNHNMINLLIKSLISIGSCFDGTNNYNDLILSVNFKEEAKKLFKQLNQLDKDSSTESEIYTALMSVYKELALQQESQNNFTKAIEYLTKQLEVIFSNNIRISQI
jgi:tetratricopeptide (TPR) repeat protein